MQTPRLRRIWRHRLAILGVPLAGIFFLASPAPDRHLRGALAKAAEEVAASEIEVAIEQGLVTLVARNVPLADVFRVIGDEAGFKVIVRGDLTTPITRSFAGVPLEKAIRRLVGDTTMVMIYAPSRGGAGPGPLAELRLYSARGPLVAQTQAAPEREALTENLHLPDLAEQKQLARLQEVQWLALRKDDSATGTLVQIVADRDEDLIVRERAVEALGDDLRGEQAAATLASAAAGEDTSVRIQAIRALSKIGDEAATEALREVLTGGIDPEARRSAAWVLGTLRSESARFVLEAAVATDPDEGVRDLAASALAGWEN